MLENIRKLIVRALRLDCEPDTNAAIDRTNVRNIRLMASVVAVLEGVVLLYALFSPTVAAATRFTSAFSLAFIIALCGVAIALANRMLASARTRPLAAWALLATLFAVASAWGMLASFRHYAEGGQIITFYIVQLCFVCFLVIRPVRAAVMFGGSYGIFYLVLYLFDGAPGINKANYALFALLSIVGAIVRYQTQVDEIRERREVDKLNRKLYRTSTHDELTGLLNRHALRDRFESFLGREVCVMLLDVDEFKRYNDTFGHLAGDAVITAVARVTRDSFPDGSTFRYGGDELLVIQGETDEGTMRDLISDWRRSISGIAVEGVSEPISCSSGMVHGTPATAADLRHMIRLADDGLYREKSARGRSDRA